MSEQKDSSVVCKRALELFQKTFLFATGSNDKEIGLVLSSAPGRVNLIGEHTDYNDGFVFPMAIPKRTAVVARLNQLDKYRMVSGNIDGSDNLREFCSQEDLLKKSEKPTWDSYVRGVMIGFLKSEHPEQGLDALPGIDLAIVGEVPLGGGLSSSASLEVAVATALESLLTVKMSGKGKALLCQRAEHWAGVPCGLMDQYISSCAVEGHALLLDCRSQEAQQVPLDDPSVSILIINSNVKHELVGGEYADRRRQCHEAVRRLAVKMMNNSDSESKKSITALRDVDVDDLKLIAPNTGDPEDELIFKRARHVVTENQRTLEASTALKARNYQRMGQLMIESHRSLQHDFEVSCRELDLLVDLALKQKGVYGSRMTGGGFGGSIVTLIASEHAQAAIDVISQEYKQATGIEALCILCTADQGAKLHDINAEL